MEVYKYWFGSLKFTIFRSTFLKELSLLLGAIAYSLFLRCSRFRGFCIPPFQEEKQSRISLKIVEIQPPQKAVKTQLSRFFKYFLFTFSKWRLLMLYCNSPPERNNANTTMKKANTGIFGRYHMICWSSFFERSAIGVHVKKKIW